MHYLNLLLVISLVGTVAGTVLGFWMAANITELYQQFYKFPVLEFRIDRLAIISVFLLTTLAALLGTWVAVRRAIQLPLAEAMRPEPPASYRPTLLERWLPAKAWTPELRMVVRGISRRPLKSSFSVLGLAMAVSVMILGSFTLDAVNYMMDFQFRQAQRQDLMVTFIEPATAAVMYELTSLPGVLDSEMMRSVATRIQFQHRERRVGLMGLEPEPQLYRLLDRREQVVQVPEFGLMLNSMLAELLGVQLGDELTVEVLEGKRPTVVFEVTAIVEEYAGVNAYIHKARLHELLKESQVASGAFLKVDANRMQQVFQELESRPGIASVAIKDAVIDSFQATVAENILVMRTFIVVFAAVMVSGLETDNYRIPLVISRSTLGMAALVVIIATIVSGLIVQRRINQLDLVAVLKTRE